MYQTSESIITKNVGSNGRGGGGPGSQASRPSTRRKVVHYHYTDDWYSYQIDSSKFNRAYAKNKNPDNIQWPFESETFVNDSVYMDMFKLNKDLNQRLGEVEPIPYPIENIKQIYEDKLVSDSLFNKMRERQLYDPEIRGNALYFFTEKCGNESKEDKIGQMRIRF